MNIEFNKQELDTLTQLLDIAIKAQGLQVAAVALHFAQKIEAAVRTEQAPTIVTEQP